MATTAMSLKNSDADGNKFGGGSLLRRVCEEEEEEGDLWRLLVVGFGRSLGVEAIN